MIALFRKNRKEMAEQNRLAQYLRYAIGEIVLVVVGILIALQINQWNEQRKGRKTEKFFLENLLVSIDNSKEELERVEKDSEAGYRSSDTLLGMIAEGVMPDLRVLDSLVFDSMDHSIYSADQAVVKEIISTGNLSLIQNKSLRQLIASWDSRMHEINKFELHTKDRSKEFVSFLGDYVDIVRVYKDSTSSMISEESARELIGNKRFHNNLASMMVNHIMLNGLYREELKVLDSMQQCIEDSLDKSP